MTVLWVLIGCGTALTNSTDGDECLPPAVPIDVYSNENTTSKAHSVLSTNPSTIAYNPAKRSYGYDPKVCPTPTLRNSLSVQEA